MKVATKTTIQKLIDNLDEFYVGFQTSGGWGPNSIAPKWKQKFSWKQEIAEADGFKLSVEIGVTAIQTDPGVDYEINYLIPIITGPEGQDVLFEDDDFEIIEARIKELAIPEIDPEWY